MNRPIKFRAWDGEKICNVEELTGNSGLWRSKDGIRHSVELHPLMQFTGLLDKNGKEIYEGDICEFTRAGRKERHEIDWNDIRHGWAWLHQNPLDMEIIGNIYENSDLTSTSFN